MGGDRSFNSTIESAGTGLIKCQALKRYFLDETLVMQILPIYVKARPVLPMWVIYNSLDHGYPRYLCAPVE